ncbi:Thiosulfate sulfurtransferase rdl2, mitochondrial [Friedmanniomyces endolithicus]|uniref:Thiosulfate sulfurtransferase rdl2, mitochondrial n=1 Tax=Friedmanniomyces endolithicus TaxID=329885 RepID=A0AAN6R187_9PEZI|nr:Thiosulfate sulfurtransferase rdl2, mitochondrial [Friedmanniomyces endolithicus]KAK0815444.1 Thiosulfate sulfurtransferase rdl2, mitochondrial [Friedmanniomyces endolithicus]KAK0818232.1 Thiosulfate sulfurtransferase rdl2, mitochondrial [Friedmanniomyces endolithicus]KAK0819430.1 Thiosulfate sulfurtransferase rdl2, mitochondrial [Friedmanniomyces endolithicus]KAK0843983.1 Thiosulfate sulfurtransferase rdl2, mitochondrial [Friedmanniomyces endolithicus]
MPSRLWYSALGSSAYRACLRGQQARLGVSRLVSLQGPRARVLRPAFVPVRWLTAPSKGKVYEFQDMQKFSSSPSPDRVLVDVREPVEYEEGYIPGAINIPIKSQPDAMFLPEDEFEDRFGFSKPDPEKEVVFYCKSGVRSSAAAQFAKQHGYSDVAEYRGSWLDWQKNGGQATKP